MGVEKKIEVRLEGQVQHFQPKGKKRMLELRPPVSSDLPLTSGARKAGGAGKNIKVLEDVKLPRVLDAVWNLVKKQKGNLSVFTSLTTALHGIKNPDPKKLAEQNIYGEIIRSLFRRAGEGS